MRLTPDDPPSHLDEQPLTLEREDKRLAKAIGMHAQTSSSVERSARVRFIALRLSKAERRDLWDFVAIAARKLLRRCISQGRALRREASR